MRISAISVMNNYCSSFKGVTRNINRSSEEDSYDGQISGSSIDGHYHTWDESEYNIYHPFKDETEKEISEALKRNNYSHSYDNAGIYVTSSCTTERGKQLPFTKKEWQNLPEKLKNQVLELLG